MSEDKHPNDFLENVFFNYTTAELKLNYLAIIDQLEQTFTKVPEETFKVLKRQASCRSSMQLFLTLMVVQGNNCVAACATQHANPIHRKEFFAQYMHWVLDPFLRPQHAGDSRVPDCTNLMDIGRQEYKAYRDEGGRFQAFYESLPPQPMSK
jgi:hypothetical protein